MIQLSYHKTVSIIHHNHGSTGSAEQEQEHARKEIEGLKENLNKFQSEQREKEEIRKMLEKQLEEAKERELGVKKQLEEERKERRKKEEEEKKREEASKDDYTSWASSSTFHCFCHQHHYYQIVSFHINLTCSASGSTLSSGPPSQIDLRSSEGEGKGHFIQKIIIMIHLSYHKAVSIRITIIMGAQIQLLPQLRTHRGNQRKASAPKKDFCAIKGFCTKKRLLRHKRLLCHKRLLRHKRLPTDRTNKSNNRLARCKPA